MENKQYKDSMNKTEQIIKRSVDFRHRNMLSDILLSFSHSVCYCYPIRGWATW